MKKLKWNAKEYEKYSSGQQKWADELLVKLKLKGNESILDLGCGDGRVTAKIASMVINSIVKGVDNSKEMIKLAQKKYPLEKYNNLSFEVMDARELPYVNQFDVVFSNAALHWVHDHHSVLTVIHRSLRPGGRILIQTGGKGNAAAAFDIIEEMASVSEWLPYLLNAKSPYNFCSDEEYKTLLPETGFTPVRIELLEKDMVHNGIMGFKGFIRTTWLPYTLRIPEEKREKFISDAAGLYIKKYPVDKDGKVHIHMVRLEAEAIKTNQAHNF